MPLKVIYPSYYTGENRTPTDAGAGRLGFLNVSVQAKVNVHSAVMRRAMHSASPKKDVK